MGRKRKPPQSAEELLERYALGERDFAAATLQAENLSSANLQFVCLNGAWLEEADFSGANLHGAELVGARLRMVNLEGANLSNARLDDAFVFGSNLSSANLDAASLREANLTAVNFEDANLASVSLSGAVLRESNLRGANLTGADLVGASLDGAHLEDTKLGGVTLAFTGLADVNLTPLCEATVPPVVEGPCYVDHRSIAYSLGSARLKEFLQRTGMPEVFVEYMIDCARTVDPKGALKMLQSTFISYGGPDEPFARKLYEALHKNGVTTFFFPEHAVPGKKIGRTMRQGVNDFDRILLICSKDSLDRKGVLAEIEHSLSREDREGGAELVIPVVLDDYLFSGWNPAKPDVLFTLKERVAADFRGWDTDPARFDTGLRRLIGALKK